MHIPNRNITEEKSSHVEKVYAVRTLQVEHSPRANTRSTEKRTAQYRAVTLNARRAGQLIVGPNIKLQGAEITNCDILVVEGRVEAAMNSRQIRISESGVFVGKAEIDIAEVGGLFDGELTVREHLVIRSTGKVKGKIRYGTVTIEQGGVISGDVGLLTEAPATRTADPASATQTSLPKHEPAPPEITPESLGFARNSVGRR
jgi:cytoskeletal protein CcmA (bactofilin family)